MTDLEIKLNKIIDDAVEKCSIAETYEAMTEIIELAVTEARKL